MKRAKQRSTSTRTITISALAWALSITGCVNAPSADDIVIDSDRMAEAAELYEQIEARHSRSLDMKDFSLEYLEWGDKNGIPLVWLHGYTSSSFELAEAGPVLASMGYHVYALTYRGHGRSQVEDYDFSIYTIADDVADFMQQLGIDRAVIGGWSLGGHISSAFYASYPTRVSAIVLVDGGAMWPRLITEAYAAEQQGHDFATAEVVISDPHQIVFETREKGVEWVLASYFSNYVRPLDAAMTAYAHSYLLPGSSGEWGLHYDHAQLMGSWADLDDLAGSHRLKLLPRSFQTILPEVIYRNLDVPVLLIDPTGDDDNVLFRRSSYYRGLAEQHPRWIEYVEYSDTPHAAHLNRPEWFLRDMKRLMARIDRVKAD